MRKSFKQRTVLVVIKISRKLFFKTAVHRNKFVINIYDRLFRSAYKPGVELLIDYENAKFYFPSNDVTIVPSLLNDNYEKFEIKLFKERIKKGSVIADIGANVGLYSVIASKLTGDSGQVYCFEPEPSNYELLLKNMRLNKCKNMITEPIAVGDKSGGALLYKESGSIGTHSLIPKTYEGQQTIEVNVVSLDKYFKNRKRIDVMKLDVEGFELNVLNGAKDTLKKVKVLFFEYTSSVDNSNKKVWPEGLNYFSNFYIINEKDKSLKVINPNAILKLAYANIMATK